MSVLGRKRSSYPSPIVLKDNLDIFGREKAAGVYLGDDSSWVFRHTKATGVKEVSDESMYLTGEATCMVGRLFERVSTANVADVVLIETT